ncbi:MAG TPA: hypothetical protein VMY34_01250 [Acidimicrobiales bacterium]|nr:hypothetical protein [Acidimicrobiales bacterium]
MTEDGGEGHRASSEPVSSGDILGALRFVAGTLAAGIVAGAIGGAGARLAMWLVKLGNGSYNGQVTHDGYEVGRLTLEGFMNLVGSTAFFYGIPIAFLYFFVQWWLPGRGWQKGAWFGAWLLAWSVPLVIDVGNYEYYRYANPLRGFALFAALIPFTTISLAFLADRWGGGSQAMVQSVVVRWSGRAVLIAIAAIGVTSEIETFRSVAHAF